MLCLNRSAEDALKGFNDDKELRMNAAWARVPMKEEPKSGGQKALSDAGSQVNRQKRNSGGPAKNQGRNNMPRNGPTDNGLLPTPPATPGTLLAPPGTLKPSASKVPDTKPVKFNPLLGRQAQSKPVAASRTVPQMAQKTREVPPKKNEEKPQWNQPRKVEILEEMPSLEQGTQPCNLCCKKADLRCERCGDYYCSAECQRKDWRAHKPNCFPMP